MTEKDIVMRWVEKSPGSYTRQQIALMECIAAEAIREGRNQALEDVVQAIGNHCDINRYQDASGAFCDGYYAFGGDALDAIRSLQSN